MATKTLLYTEVVEIAQDYLGPVTDRFMTRLIEAHLTIQPSELTTDDLTELKKWLRLSVSVLTADEKLVDEFMSRLSALENDKV